jgi:16S rRNA G966 N2-methylase RsmD
LHSQRRDVVTLDIDERFSNLPGFRHWSIWRPTPLDESFDLILVDPPFFSVSLSQLFSSVRMLAKFDLTTKIAISYLKRREAAIMGTFTPFGLRPSGYQPGYKTVQNCERNTIEFYTNFGAMV